MEYVAETLRLSAQGKYLKKSWAEVIRPPKPVDADEVISGLVKAGAVVIV